MKIRRPSLLAVMYALSVASVPAMAQSTDYESLLHGYLGRGKIDNHTQQVVQTNISTRQAQLEQEIAAGVASGQLNASEEADLKAQLDRIANLHGQYLATGGGKLNNIQIQNLLTELSGVTTKLQAYLTNATTATATATPQHDRWFRQNPEREGYSWNRMAEGHVDSYQAEILASVQQALTQGKISVSTAQSLRAQLNQTDVDQRRMTADGRLSRSESQQLMDDLDRIKNRLSQEIASNNQRWRGRGHHYGWGNHSDDTNIAYGQSMLRQRIYDGLRSGKLSRTEADRLLSDERRIADLEARMSASGGRLSWSEQRRLLAERDQLNAEINQELTDHNTW